jgi:hypothetical protein
MDSADQKKIRMLLRLEVSKPIKVIPFDPYGFAYTYLYGFSYKGLKSKITEWRIEGLGAGDGLLHREFGPAIESEDGYIKQWYRFGEKHREDGPASIVGKKIEYWIRAN